MKFKMFVLEIFWYQYILFHTNFSYNAPKNIIAVIGFRRREWISFPITLSGDVLFSRLLSQIHIERCFSRWREHQRETRLSTTNTAASRPRVWVEVVQNARHKRPLRYNWVRGFYRWVWDLCSSANLTSQTRLSLLREETHVTRLWQYARTYTRQNYRARSRAADPRAAPL